MLSKIYTYLYNKVYYLLNFFRYKHLAKTATIRQLLRVDGKENISIQSEVIIQKLTWLAAVPITGFTTCKLVIGEGTIIGHFNHIYATSEVVIGKYVLTADKVYIADNQHAYEDVETPISKQKIVQLDAVKIGDGTWIGEMYV